MRVHKNKLFASSSQKKNHPVMKRLIPSENPFGFGFGFVLFESFFVESVITMFGCNVKKKKTNKKTFFKPFLSCKLQLYKLSAALNKRMG